MQEIFKEIENYPNYEVSNYGRVRSKARALRFVHSVTGGEHFRAVDEIFLKNHKNRGGYYVVSLRNKEIAKQHRIHQLVMNAFTERPEWAECINHIDGNKLNNRLDNLEWCTIAKNNLHAKENSLLPKGERVKGALFTDKTVYGIKNLIKMGIPHTVIAEAFGVHDATINAINKNWKHVQPKENLKSICFRMALH